MNETITIAKRGRGRPRIKPTSGIRRVHIDWLPSQHYALVKRIGHGNFSAGLREILDGYAKALAQVQAARRTQSTERETTQ